MLKALMGNDNLFMFHRCGINQYSLQCSLSPSLSRYINNDRAQIISVVEWTSIHHAVGGTKGAPEANRLSIQMTDPIQSDV